MELVELSVELRLLLVREAAQRFGQVVVDLRDPPTRIRDDQVARRDDRVDLGGNREQLADHTFRERVLGIAVGLLRPTGQTRHDIPDTDEPAADIGVPFLDTCLHDLEISLELGGKDLLRLVPLLHGRGRQVLELRRDHRLRVLEDLLGLGGGRDALRLLGRDHAALARGIALSGALTRGFESSQRPSLQRSHVSLGLAQRLLLTLEDLGRVLLRRPVELALSVASLGHRPALHQVGRRRVHAGVLRLLLDSAASWSRETLPAGTASGVAA